jgi:hypothetical protein
LGEDERVADYNATGPPAVGKRDSKLFQNPWW